MSQSALESLFQFAEDPALFVHTSVANNVTSLAYLLLQSNEVHQAIQSITADPTTAERVVRRVRLLLTQQLPTNERHPYDVSVAAYLFVLGRSNASGLGQALQAVRDSGLRNLDWAYAMHNWLLAGAPSDADQYANASLPATAGLAAAPALNSCDLGECAQALGSCETWDRAR